MWSEYLLVNNMYVKNDNDKYDFYETNKIDNTSI